MRNLIDLTLSLAQLGAGGAIFLGAFELCSGVRPWWAWVVCSMVLGGIGCGLGILLLVRIKDLFPSGERRASL